MIDYRWLIKTFTQEYDAVIDIFAGSGGMASVCGEEKRHCLCIDRDEEIFQKHLQKFGDVLSLHSDDDTDWNQYEPPSEQST